MCGLTGSEEGVAALRQCPALLEILVSLLVDPTPVIATDAALALINLSADTNTVPVLLGLKVSVVNNLYKVKRKKDLTIRSILFSMFSFCKTRRVIRLTRPHKSCPTSPET